MGLGGVAFSVGWFALIFCSGLRRASDLEKKVKESCGRNSSYRFFFPRSGAAFRVGSGAGTRRLP
jgi:hypothetical protein